MLIHMRDEAKRNARDAEASPSKYGRTQDAMARRTDLVAKLQKQLTQVEKPSVLNSENRAGLVKDGAKPFGEISQPSPGSNMMNKLRTILQAKISAFKKSAV